MGVWSYSWFRAWIGFFCVLLIWKFWEFDFVGVGTGAVWVDKEEESQTCVRETLELKAFAHPFENVQLMLPPPSWLGLYPVPETDAACCGSTINPLGSLNCKCCDGFVKLGTKFILSGASSTTVDHYRSSFGYNKRKLGLILNLSFRFP